MSVELRGRALVREGRRLIKNNALNDKKIIVTGGNGGIGSALIQEFLKAGAEVTATVRNEEGALELRKQFAREIDSGKLTIEKLDLSSKNSIETFAATIRTTAETKGKFDLIVHNAGAFVDLDIYLDDQNLPRKTIDHGREYDDNARLMQVNVLGVTLLEQLTDRHVRTSAPVTSVSAFRDFEEKDGFLRDAGYGQTKRAFAWVMLTRARQQQADKNHCIVLMDPSGKMPDGKPRFVKTKMSERAWKNKTLPAHAITPDVSARGMAAVLAYAMDNFGKLNGRVVDFEGKGLSRSDVRAHYPKGNRGGYPFTP